MTDELDFVEAPSFELRDYQVDCLNAIREGWNTISRSLAVLCTGAGKTIIFSQVIKEEIGKGGKVLVLCHTDELIDQAIDKLEQSTGIEADKEKANEVASPHSAVVVASIQTLCRTDRLMGFADDHFSLVIADEAHLSLAASWTKALRYFHYGAASLDEGWTVPADGTYQHKARVLGVTATADRGDKRTLGEFYQKCVYEYGLLAACRDGYLVRPIVKNIPLKIDLKRQHEKERITIGGDYSSEFVENRITPFLDQIAFEIAKESLQRKTVVFTPSILTAQMLAEALKINSLNADFVSGACTNRSEKIQKFESSPPGSAIVCAMLLAVGWDCPSANTVCILRPTKIRSLFVQCAGRGTRTLPGTIDGLKTREERLAAIAASAKPSMLILDFLWIADRLDLIRPVDLIGTKPEIKEGMERNGIEDLLESEAVANRDFLKSLEKTVKQHARKKARTIDPLAWAVSLGDESLKNYVPETGFDEFPAQPAQLEYIAKNGFTVTGPICRGLANKIIERITSRETHGLCTPKQMNFLRTMGFREDTIVMMPKDEATKCIGRIIAGRRH
jgi:superfamily II DNA or RNA helicase